MLPLWLRLKFDHPVIYLSTTFFLRKGDMFPSDNSLGVRLIGHFGKLTRCIEIRAVPGGPMHCQGCRLGVNPVSEALLTSQSGDMGKRPIGRACIDS
jgi:hypothetical protein